MKTMGWCDLLIKHKDIAVMDTEDLDALCRATDDRLLALAHGVSGIGNLLACAASNSETGLSLEAVKNIGWMLESLGGLISNLSDTNSEAVHQISEMPKARKPKAA
ncbi:hypothetical protein SAMN05444506_12489 [Pseudomonas syringae]|uniref:Uncharacterized protein n=1 Tax=Pseudomonas syringae pv. apii TaxID=81036 RepID=A0A3M3RGX5_9PSED|nr:MULTISPECIES: hypothetical protein [Pseudomonas syringae group]RMN51785.1 hypothetical protein ALQ59_101938 [Pseudomonas syringae pv. apii]RMN53721.1 hypothetical protein ALQ58_101699 [Pseudomonas syringae pv. apii]RMN95700.1 hypothetical protein ALQ49_101410 [Pseudomonas syringae pv. apii]SDZ53592.1 hypothetical protein SAMN05444506_12489 [Pseudomonas syringae]